MASVYAQGVLGVKEPRVGLLSIGEEAVKGNELVLQTRALLKESPINFCGNAEGRDVFTGKFDVVVCDGFVGNVLLKVVEAMAEGVFQILTSEVATAEPELAARLEPIFKKVAGRHDYASYGGAPLLGIDGICMISHGSSKARAIMNALKAASQFSKHRVNEAIEAALTTAGKVA